MWYNKFVKGSNKMNKKIGIVNKEILTMFNIKTDHPSYSSFLHSDMI